MTPSSSPPSPHSLDELNRRVAVSREPFPIAELRCFPLLGRSGKWGYWLREGGRELWLYTIEHDWFFLWVVDVDEGRGRCRVSVPIEPRAFHYEAALRQDTLWLIADDEVIEISVTEWKIRSRRPYLPLLPEGALLASFWTLPNSQYLWLETYPPNVNYVVDLETWSLRRCLPDSPEFPLPLVGSPRTLLGFAEVKRGDNLFTVDGSPIPGTRLPIDYKTRSVAYAPGGEGLLSLEVVDDDESLSETSYMTLHHLVREEGSGSFKSVSSLRRRVYEESPHGGIFRLAVSSEESTCFVLIHVCDRESRIFTHLLAVALSKRGLWVRYRVKVPHDTVLAQDPEARRVIAICTEPDALHVIPLGRGRPSALEELPYQVYGHRGLLIPIVELNDWATCGEPVDSNDDSLSRPLAWELKTMDHSDRLRVIGHYRAGAHDDAEELVTLYYALSRANMSLTGEQKRDIEREREAILDVLREELAEHPSAALTLADYEAHAERFQEADRWLKVAQGGLDRRRQHYHHLKALVHFHAGRGYDAYEELLRAIESERRYACSLSGLFRLCKPMAADSPDEADSGSMVRPLLAAIRTTNQAFAAGDFASVFAALDNSLYWQELEVETSARRAAAVLRMPVCSDAERIRKRFVLARFREAIHQFLGPRRIRLPGVTWDDERIERVEEAARAWLENEPAVTRG